MVVFEDLALIYDQAIDWTQRLKVAFTLPPVPSVFIPLQPIDSVVGCSMAADSPDPHTRLDPRRWRIICLYCDEGSFDVEQD
ncbi:MAG: hypothetical protein ACFFBU_02140 [Promethearchaeota archaeon]